MKSVKSYTSLEAANRAIKNQGISEVPHKVYPRDGKFVPVFTPELQEDRDELRRRGWEVK